MTAYSICITGILPTTYAIRYRLLLGRLNFACAYDVARHGNFTTYVVAVANELKKAEDISGLDKTVVQCCAAESVSSTYVNLPRA